jgi:hypothetical protein
MAARWMQSKMDKMKRDGMAASRGPYDRFKDTPGKRALETMPRRPGDGWYAVCCDGSIPRGLPRSIGPFDTQAEAQRAGRLAWRGEYRTYERAAPPPDTAPKAPTLSPDMVADMVSDYRAKQAAVLEHRKAEREALGKRTRFSWTRT